MSPDLRIRFVESPAAIGLPGHACRSVRQAPVPGVAEEQAETPSRSGSEDPSRESDAEQSPGAHGDPENRADGDAAASTDREPKRDRSVTPDWAVAQGRFEELMRRIDSEVAHLEQRFAEEIRRLEPQLVQLSLAVTSKVLGEALDAGSVDLAPLIRDGLARITNSMRDPKRITIRIGADHKSVVDEVLAERKDDQGRIRIELDPTLKPFACEIHCDMRQVSIDLQRELRRIGAALLGGGPDDD